MEFELNKQEYKEDWLKAEKQNDSGRQKMMQSFCNSFLYRAFILPYALFILSFICTLLLAKVNEFVKNFYLQKIQVFNLPEMNVLSLAIIFWFSFTILIVVVYITWAAFFRKLNWIEIKAYCKDIRITSYIGTSTGKHGHRRRSRTYYFPEFLCEFEYKMQKYQVVPTDFFMNTSYNSHESAVKRLKNFINTQTKECSLLINPENPTETVIVKSKSF